MLFSDGEAGWILSTVSLSEDLSDAWKSCGSAAGEWDNPAIWGLLACRGQVSKLICVELTARWMPGHLCTFKAAYQEEWHVLNGW